MILGKNNGSALLHSRNSGRLVHRTTTSWRFTLSGNPVFYCWLVAPGYSPSAFSYAARFSGLPRTFTAQTNALGVLSKGSADFYIDSDPVEIDVGGYHLTAGAQLFFHVDNMIYEDATAAGEASFVAQVMAQATGEVPFAGSWRLNTGDSENPDGGISCARIARLAVATEKPIPRGGTFFYTDDDLEWHPITATRAAWPQVTPGAATYAGYASEHFTPAAWARNVWPTIKAETIQE